MRKSISVLLAIALIFAALPAIADRPHSSSSTPLDGASGGALNNITLAAEAIDGLYIPYGGTFSFNDTVGPRTKECGYKNAVNGRGVKVCGGGVAQVATTLYLALLGLDGIVYTDISTYGDRFTGGYVSDGELAIATDYANGTDFAFQNYQDDLVISMWVSDDTLNCRISCDSFSDTQPAEGYVFISGAAIGLDGSSGLISNVYRAAESIDGTAIASGETFSFNDIVGPRTKESGYVDAINGRGVKVCGGGVAQVASVVWLAVEELDCIKIVEKSTYGNRYNQSYVESAADAILTDYSAGTDFSFRNTGDDTLYIYTYIENGALCCDIYIEDGETSTQPVLNW